MHYKQFFRIALHLVEYIPVHRTRHQPCQKAAGAEPGKTTNSDALASDFYLSRPMRIDRHELMRHYCAAVSRPAQKTASFGVDPLVTICAETLYRFTGRVTLRVRYRRS